MRSGRLKDKVSIESPPTGDGYTQPVGTWSEVAVRRCSIEPMNGREYWAQSGERSNEKVIVRFRYESGLLNHEYRLVDNRVSPQVIYDIESIVNPGNENRELICTCTVRQ